MTDLIIGLGQIGQPIARLLGNNDIDVIVRDIEDIPDPGPITAAHICYAPGEDLENGGFVDVTVNYLKQYTPRFCFIHSTVVPGTSREIQKQVPFVDIIYSPVRGRHGDFDEDLVKYDKWMAAMHEMALRSAVLHVGHIWNIREMRRFETLELAKLLETSYTGVLIAWAQVMNRYADAVGADLDQAIEFTDELDYLPAYQFVPSYIGGHCIMPNIDILQEVLHTDFLQSVIDSNEKRKEELQSRELAIPRRVYPKKLR